MDVDAALVRACQRGEPGALDELICSTYADVYALSQRMLANPDEAADATQEVYVRVTRSVLGFRGESAFGTWLHRVTVNVCLTALKRRTKARESGTVAVLCAGTSDVPVAEEAAVTADIMGNHVERIYDVGVAGLHRLLRRLELIQSANVIIAVAGMEGALPSVVAGLVSRPLIAVPTSVGYGANFGGLAALLGMLNSCGSGVTVVNIDNGFGAGYAASQINALASGSA